MPPTILLAMMLAQLPKHIAAGDGVAITEIAAGCVMVTMVVPVHPFASVAVKVYVPAHKLFEAGE